MIIIIPMYDVFHVVYSLTITASCPMNLQYFPMDRQLCHIEIESCKCLCVSTLYDAYFIILYIIGWSLSYDNDCKIKSICTFFFFLLISVSFYPADSTEPRARGEKDQALCTYNCIPKINYTKKINKITLHNNILLLSTNCCQQTITRI